MINFPAPYVLQISYTTVPTPFSAQTHKLNIGVKLVSDPAIGTVFNAITTESRDATNDSLDTVLSDLIDQLKDVYKTTTDFVRADLLKYDGTSFEATWVASADIGVAGTSTAATQVAWQNTFSFRTSEGNWSKLQLMESVIGGESKQGFPTSDGTVNAIAGYMVGVSQPFIGRDGGFLLAKLNLSSGQNEKLWRKYYRT